MKHASSSADFQDTGNQINTLQEIKIKNANRSIIGHLNVNSLRNKFEMLEEIIKYKIDIFLIFVTKRDSSFPRGQFIIQGYNTPFKLDRNQSGRGLLLYVHEDIPCKTLNEYNREKPIGNFFVEINLRSRKWLRSFSYNPNVNLIADHLHHIGRGIDFYYSKYDNFNVFDDLNTEFSNLFLEQFCASYNLKCFIKEPTCFKSVDNPSCVDLIY